MLILLILLVSALALLVWAWIAAIDSMNQKHPDYKGEDFLQLNRGEAPWENDEWDNQHHNEDV
jgi:hypothetical protein